ncbi:amidohydrolase family protein [Acidisoma cellulosilytica]|uniref:Amidohydrolase family protein n=1 Tax=Acidisoma cellulosilyticum TaxID=2802395 RepID=A0A964E6K8_9PROT|nr:amidohydrolase family protein [Acidisoma cellulosilyticum]MCB8883562.1 amidohydrolase family protein [Acidisoma cellulosilyticum]
MIRGAVIVTMDEHLGEFSSGDILIEEDRIAAIGPSLDLSDVNTEIVEAPGWIVAPGFINAHMHTWQTGLRSAAANWTLLEYFRWVHAGLATRFTPEDIGIATLAGALNQINSGTTTLVDWCHNNPTPAHTDAAVAALQESGIRAAFFHGSPKPDPRPGERHFSEIPHPRREIERLLAGPFSSRSGKLSLGMAILGPHYATLEVALADFRLSREFGLIASMHQGGGAAKTPEGWDVLEAENLLGPLINIVHGNDLSDDRLARFAAQGVTFSVAPENEMIQGHGHPITGRLRALGVAPSLGVDIESVVGGSMIAVARAALSHQRALDNAASRVTTGAIPPTTTIRTGEALSWITRDGARMLGQQDRIGRLAPGLQADLILVRADDLDLWPVHDPVATLIMHAHTGSIDSVMIAGRWHKRGGRLLGFDLGPIRAALARSGQRILAELRWPQGAA